MGRPGRSPPARRRRRSRSTSSGHAARPATRTTPARLPASNRWESSGPPAFSRFRHASDWVGRIAPTAGSEAVGEEAFVRLWGGTLPDEPLTLSGAVKLPASSAWLTSDRRPDRPRPVNASGPSRPSTSTIAPGRIDLALDAELTETAGPVHEVEIACPDGFRVVRVAADGLTDWAITSTPRRSLGSGSTARRFTSGGSASRAGSPSPPTRSPRLRSGRPGRSSPPGPAGPARTSSRGR